MKFEIPFKGKNYDWNVEIVTNDSTASAATLDPARNVNLRFGSPGGYDVSGAILTSNFQLEVLDPDSTLYNELYDIQDDGSISVLLYTTDTAETYKWKGYVRLDTMDRTIAPDVNTPVVSVYCYDALTRLKDDQEIFGITGSKTGSRSLLKIIGQAMQAVRREQTSTYNVTSSAVGDMYVEYLFDVDTGISGATNKFINTISLKDSTYYGEDGLEGDPYKVLEEVLENFDIRLFQRTLNTQPIVNVSSSYLTAGATIDFPRWAAYKRSLFGTSESLTDRKTSLAYYVPFPLNSGTLLAGTIGYAATAVTADDIRVDGKYVRKKPLKAVTVDTKITDFSLEETTITRGVGLGTAVVNANTVTIYDYTDYWGTAGTAFLISAGTYVSIRGAAVSPALTQDSLVVGTGFRGRIHVAMESQAGGSATADYLLVRVKDAGTAAIGAATIFVPIGGTERATIGAASYGFYNTQLINDGTQGTAPTTAADLTASVTAQLRVEIEYPTTFGGATIVDAGGTKTANSAGAGGGTARVKSVSVFLEDYSGNVGKQKKSWKAEIVNDNVQIGDKVELKSSFSNILLERNALDEDQPNFFTVDGFSGTFYDIAQLFAQGKMVGYQKPRDVLDIELMGLYPPELPLQYTNSGGSTTTFIVGGGIELDLVNETTKGTWVELTTSDESDPLVETTPTDPGTIVP